MTTKADLEYWNKADLFSTPAITGANSQFSGDLDAPDYLPRGSTLASSPLAPMRVRTEHYTARARIRTTAFRNTVPRNQ
jgi:hypothetical protein